MKTRSDNPKIERDLSRTPPGCLDQFVGQDHVVAAVKVALDATRHDGGRFPHALLVGPPGLGKSNLVQIVANELGVDLRETLAQSLLQSIDLATLLLEAESRQVVFIDEADELPPHLQTLLYRALAEDKLFLPRCRPSGIARSLPLESFTLMMATNHESRLARPLVERFRMLLRFEFYSTDEILDLLIARAKSLEWECDSNVVMLLALRSRGIPRVGLRLLESVRRIARSERADIISLEHFHRMSQVDGIDQRGLDRTERAYLRILQAEGKAVRLNVIADRLGLPPRTLSGVVEPFLIRERLITRSDEGRELTPEGANHLLNSVAFAHA
jgi:Holliday junction DNA helicase RuvB